MDLESSRVANACHSCAIAKVRCSDVKPCVRCQKRGSKCITNAEQAYPGEDLSNGGTVLMESLDFLDEFSSFIQHSGESNVNIPEEDPIASQIEDRWIDQQFPAMERVNEGAIRPPYNVTQLQDATPITTLISPENPASHTKVISGDPDVPMKLAIHQDDLAFTDIQPNVMANQLLSFSSDLSTDSAENDIHCSMDVNEMRQNFQISPWYSKSNRSKPYTCYSGPKFPSDKESIKSLCVNAHSAVPQLFDQSIRDNLLATFARKHNSTDNNSPAYNSFPSSTVMDVLADRFLRKQDMKLNSWIHTATFSPESANFELTCMILAGGALSTQIGSLRQWGNQLCKLVKRQIFDSVRTSPDAFKLIC